MKSRCPERIIRNTDKTVIRCCGHNGQDLKDPKMRLVSKQSQALPEIVYMPHPFMK